MTSAGLHRMIAHLWPGGRKSPRPLTPKPRNLPRIPRPRAQTLVVVVLLVVAGCTGGVWGLCADVETGCTDGKRTIVLNTQFIEHATDDEVALVALHETAHIVLKHGETRGDTRLKELAADRWALDMLKPDIDACRLARVLKVRKRPLRADVLCPEDSE